MAGGTRFRNSRVPSAETPSAKARSTMVHSAGTRSAGTRSVRIVVGLGSNLDPESNLVEGVRLLGQAVRLTAASRVYRTPPWGYAEQPEFLNAVAAAETELSPLALLDTQVPRDDRPGLQLQRARAARLAGREGAAWNALDDISRRLRRSGRPRPLARQALALARSLDDHALSATVRARLARAAR